MFLDSNAGVIAGAVIGSIAALLLIAAVGYYAYTKDFFRSKGVIIAMNYWLGCCVQ